MSDFNAGDLFGRWRLIEVIGCGGNGDVWKVENTESKAICAIKVLRECGQKLAYHRFKREIDILKRLGTHEGIIPMIDSHIEENSRKNRSWYVMPIAKPYLKEINERTVEDIISDFKSLANILLSLHDRGVSHRDIKPANLLFLDGKLCFSDFGLVKVDGLDGITPETRDVGAKYTMAPEMRRTPRDADGKIADIYSLAKSLWISISKKEYSFDGQYDENTSLSLNNYVTDKFMAPLHEILRKCTDHEPKNRITLSDFIEKLCLWEDINKDFSLRNKYEWEYITKKIFPLGPPSRVTWENPKQICEILNISASSSGLNHMFYPTGGGMTLLGAGLSPEPGMIELKISERMYSICKPKRLYFEIYEKDPQWNYFRLELEQIESALGIEELLYKSEELTEYSPGKYTELNAWFENEINGVPLSESSRRVERFSGGSFVIFSTTSIYNKISETYDARHNKLSADEFRKYIHKGADHILMMGLGK